MFRNPRNSLTEWAKNTFFARWIIPNRHRINEPPLWIAMVTGLIAAICCFLHHRLIVPDWPVWSASWETIAGSCLSYASLGFAGTLAGLTLALTLPGMQLSKRWFTAGLSSADQKNSPLSLLFFVFAYAAYLDLLLTAVSLVVLAFFPSGEIGDRTWLVGTMTWLTVYSLLCLFDALRAFCQVGHVLIEEHHHVPIHDNHT